MITVILNAYRRPQNIELQVKALRSQTVKPQSIRLWLNYHPDGWGYDYKKTGVDTISFNTHNWKFYGRFAYAMLAETEYVALFDDDTIPGAKWFENCLRCIQSNPGIYGSAGVILTGPQYIQHIRAGWPTNNELTQRVDLVGHAWFLKREWLKYMWMEMPPTWHNGEDIWLAYQAQKYGNINSYVPPHPINNPELSGSLAAELLGTDDKATSNNKDVPHAQFFGERDLVIAKALASGWRTINNVNLLRNSS